MGYNIALLIGGELVGPGDGLLLGGLVEDGLERCRCVRAECVVLVQVDAGEEGLVGEAFVLVVAALVHGGEISCEVKGSLVVVVVLGDLSLDPVKFCAQPGLELLQLFQRERVGQVRFQELVLLGKDLLAPIGEVSDGLVRARGQLVELVHQHAPQCVGHRWGEGDALVVVGDELLNPVHWRIRHVTVRALVVAAQTDEVRANVAVAILGVADRHPLKTPSTEQGAFQVVIMLLRADPGLGVGAKNGLHLVPNFWFDEPFVCPVVTDTPVDDISLVVGVLQHSMHARKPQRSRWASSVTGVPLDTTVRVTPSTPSWSLVCTIRSVRCTPWCLSIACARSMLFGIPVVCSHAIWSRISNPAFSIPRTMRCHVRAPPNAATYAPGFSACNAPAAQALHHASNTSGAVIAEVSMCGRDSRNPDASSQE
ncbi:MAG: hypothetical protein Q4C81_05850 [Kocuria sp.]|nr:hypothetical protein [Kocuria sp.]